MMKRDIRLVAIGETERLPQAVRKALDETIELTANNRALTVALAASYGGRNDIVRAAQRIAQEVEKGTLKSEDVTERSFAAHLDTVALPDPDLLIRTSGELRLSNFLLYQLSYTALYFTHTLW